LRRTWRAELLRLAALAGFALLLGWLTGQVAWALFIAAAIALLRAYRLLRRLDSWLQHGRRSEPPDAPTVWADVVGQIYHIHQRGRRRKKKMVKLLGRFRESTAAMPDAIVLLDAIGNIEWFNETAKSMLGLKPQDVGRRVGMLIRHPTFTSYLKQREHDEDVEMPWPEEPERRLNLRLVPFGNKQSLLLARDVTHVHRLEQMRRDFIGNVSHELRTPLTVITGYLEALTDHEDIGRDDVRSSLLQMSSQAERMRRIVEDLLMLSRLETREDGREQPSEVAVPGLLASIIEDARVLSGERRHEIGLESEEGLWLKGNTAELHSAFSNLVSNAVRYTPAGGRIQVRWWSDEAGAHYSVADNGIGIEAHHIPRLTERFYRIDTDRSRASGGTGLGLAIVKHVLQHHDAELRIESERGVGSTFICDFPPERMLRRTERGQAASA
jgi:two-component system phosphate regulon sensor histidine kinase PhoR